MPRRLGSFMLFLLLLADLGAQELVVNGGLEAFRKCPTGPVMERLKVDGHVKSGSGDPDLYSTCSTSFGVPGNWSGHQGAWEGDSYAGLVLTSDMPDECGMREYLQFPLQEPLENGRRYRLTFVVSPADRSGYFTDRVGAIFSSDDLSPNKVIGQLRERAMVENPLGRFIDDTTGWMTVTGVYNALGGERFVLIGNFQPCNSSSRVRVDKDVLRSTKRKTATGLDPDPMHGAWQQWITRTAYAYVDGVSLVPDTTAPSRIERLTQALACVDLHIGTIGEELIPDPGFDRNTHPAPDSWRNASDGTPDMLEGRTGIYAYSAAYTDNREYIRIPLADTLRPGATYGFRFDIQRNAEYAYAADAIGLAVTDTFTTRRDRMRMDLPVVWHSPPGLVIDNTLGPITLCGTFNSSICASQLLLGNFKPDSLCTVMRMGNTTDGPFAYYFVDNVHLWKVADADGLVDPCTPLARTAEEMGEGPGPASLEARYDRLVFHFDTDRDTLTGPKPQELSDLASTMRSDPDLHVRIVGHTDDSGSRERNERLGRSRARTLAAMLCAYGVPDERISIASEGSRMPVADNSTHEGRALNRRVELIVER
ncbi:MAG: OmpA family protein [Flavobacteriales bacterium]|nr:OmpA family protein [Flavobacteriales bacterium]